MPAKPVSPAQMEEALTAFRKCGGNSSRAAEMLGLNRSTYRNRLISAQKQQSLLSPIDPSDIELELRERVRSLETQLKTQARESLDAKYVRSKILQIRDEYFEAKPPKWLAVSEKKKGVTESVPTLLLSDLHWGEVVNEREVAGVNEYNLDIANRRLKTVGEKAVVLLRDHMKNVQYPGIVVALAGDCIAGEIHEELKETNEFPVIPVLLDLVPAMIALIDMMKREFKCVYVPCEPGNHGRMSRKPRAKQRNETNLDWLFYQLLALHFQNDPDVFIDSPTTPTMTYRVYNHIYHLMHGDQLGRGGDGIIGFFGPVIRGDHRRRSLQSQLNRPYKTLIHGHYHTYAATQKFIANGSLVGYGEYSMSEGMGFEIPQQALWLTHPEHGITFSMPVHAETPKDIAPAAWLSFEDRK